MQTGKLLEGLITVEIIFLPVFVGALMSIALGYPAMRAAERLNLMDIPLSAPHKRHERPTPLAGGILILITLSLAVLFLRQWVTREILIVLLGGLIILFFGLWDDARGLSAFPKLIGQIAASTILIVNGIHVHFVGNLEIFKEFPGTFTVILDIGITFFWLIGIANAMNMVDSMDGLVAGLSLVTSTFFLGATGLSNQINLMVWSAVLLGISVGLYFWNANPAYFFLGDSGAQTLGFLLAALGILYNPLGLKQESSWFVPIMLLSVPIFDTTLVVISRLWRRQSVRQGRRDHTYHRLIGIGFAPNRAVLLIHVAALIVNCLAFLALSFSPAWANITFGLTIVSGFMILLWLERKPSLDDMGEKSREA